MATDAYDVGTLKSNTGPLEPMGDVDWSKWTATDKEKERARLKEAASRNGDETAAGAGAEESLPALLRRLDLEAYEGALADEEIEDVAILRSMGREVLASNMASDEIGMSAVEIARLSHALFPAGPALGT